MQVPEGWSIEKFGNFAEFRNGLNFRKSSIGESVKIVGVSDFQSYSTLEDFSNLETINVENKLNDNDLLIDNDLLFVRSNGNRKLIGRCLFFPKVNEKLSFSGFTIRARIFRQDLLPKYISNLFRTNYAKNQIQLEGRGTNISNLNQQILSNFQFPFPPHAEQEKIAEILSTWDHAIEQTERLKANAETHKQALMQQLLTGKKRFPEFEGEWRKVRLSDYVAISNAKTTINDELPIITSSRKGIFLQEDYFKKQVASTNNIGYKIVPRGFITYRSMSDDGIFVFNRQNILDNTMVSPAYGVFQFININADFALELINSSNMLFEFNKLSQGGTRISLKTNSFKEIYIKVPSLEEQQKIAAVLNTADREIELLAQKLDYLKTEKRALMQQLLTGKRRVKVDG